MEDVLDLYAEPYDVRRPQVCFDESPVQLISETRQPLPVRPGQPARYDYEYRREGTANLFLFVQPLRGWRHVNVTAHRTKHDFAMQMQELVNVHFPEADVIRLVVDNLNTHTHPPHCMRPLHRPKHAGSRGSWNGTIRRSMAVGSIWPNVNSLCSPSSVWIAVFLISPCCVTKLLPGKQHVITTKRRSTGAFIRRMPASHSNDSIRRPLVRDGCLRGSVCKPLKSKRLAPVKISVVDH